MLNLQLRLTARARPRLLFLGAHCDDIEIGCGATALELLKRYPHAAIDWVVFSSDKARAAEANRAVQLLFGSAPKPRVTIASFRNSFFPSQTAEIKAYFERLKRTMSPDVVFTHFREDLHQDHRVIGELTWNTFRDHLVLEYEIPKYDGGLGSPNVFVPITRRLMQKKISVLMKAFGTQRNKQWFSPETFQGLMRLRGIECNSPSGYAEAFYGRKLIL